MKTGTKIGIYGGSFDPPHLAHQMACLYGLSVYALDEIWLMPSLKHPIKTAVASFEHRVAMCKLSCEGIIPRVKVSTLEQELPVPSYTLPLVIELQKRYPEPTFFWMLGEDLRPHMNQWRGIEELRKKMEFLFIGRQGSGGDLPLPNISSSEIRLAIQQKADISKWVPKAVLEYIEKHKLYR